MSSVPSPMTSPKVRLFILFMGSSRQEYWSGLPVPSPVDHILSDLSTMTRPSWVAPWAWLSFIELDKAVVLVWLDWLVFCDYGFSVSALWCPLATPTILLGCGVSLHSCSSKAQLLLLIFDEGYLLTTALPDLQRGIAPLGPPVPMQPPYIYTPFPFGNHKFDFEVCFCFLNKFICIIFLGSTCKRYIYLSSSDIFHLVW